MIFIPGAQFLAAANQVSSFKTTGIIMTDTSLDRADLCAGLDARLDCSGLRHPALRRRPARGVLSGTEVRRGVPALQGARPALSAGLMRGALKMPSHTFSEKL